MRAEPIVQGLWALLMGAVALTVFLAILALVFTIVGAGFAILELLLRSLAWWIALPFCAYWIGKALVGVPDKGWKEALSEAYLRLAIRSVCLFCSSRETYLASFPLRRDYS